MTLRSPQPERPSPPSPGFLGERIYYLDSSGRSIEASCVDVSTDWVPLFDVEVSRGGEVVESHKGIRGYTALSELVESRGWRKRTQRLAASSTPDAAAPPADERRPRH
jgi:hypothetical protein